METGNVDSLEERYFRDDDFYVARPEDDRRTVVEKTQEILRAYPLVRVCILLFCFAFVFRVAYNFHLGNYLIAPELRDMYDYDQVARSLLDGGGYSRPWAVTNDRGETAVEIRTTMFRPPLYTVALASAYSLTNRNPLIARVLLSSIGAATVVAIFLVTRKLYNSRVAAVAGIVAAVYPPFIAADGVLYPEALFAFLAVTLVYVLLLLREKPALYRATIAGALVGALALTRAEGAAWILLPISFVMVSIQPLSISRRAILACCAIAAALVVYTPWLHHTWSNFRTIAPSSSLGTLIAGANNRVAYYDRVYTGSWYYGGISNDRRTLYEVRDPRHNEKIVDDLFTARGLQYMRSHLERLPSVVLARILRGLDFWDPYVTARLEEGWGRPTWITYAGIAFYFPLLVFAVYAAWRSQYRWREFLPLYLMFAGFVVLSALAFGSSRFRLTADAAIIVFSSSILYGLTRTAVITRKTSLGELLDAIDTGIEDPSSEPEIPEEVMRAIKLRAQREKLAQSLGSEALAVLHEGEDILAAAGPPNPSADPAENRRSDKTRTFLRSDALDPHEGLSLGSDSVQTVVSSEIQLTEYSRLDSKTGVISLDLPADKQEDTES